MIGSYIAIADNLCSFPNNWLHKNAIKYNIWLWTQMRTDIYDILDWRQRNPQKVKDIHYVQYLVNK